MTIILHLWQIRWSSESSDVHSFSRKSFSSTAFAVSQVMTQMMTQFECIDQMWDQYYSKILKSRRILSDLVTLDEQSRVDGFSRQEELSYRNVLPNVYGGQTPADIESPFKNLVNKKVCETIGPVDNELSKVYEADVHVISYYVFMSGKTDDKHVRNQVLRKMERVSRVLQGNRKENWLRKDSVCIPRASWQQTNEIILNVDECIR